jgi:hypothetical protein
MDKVQKYNLFNTNTPSSESYRRSVELNFDFTETMGFIQSIRSKIDSPSRPTLAVLILVSELKEGSNRSTDLTYRSKNKGEGRKKNYVEGKDKNDERKENRE